MAVESVSDEHFEIEPMKKTCKFCNVEVVTYVEHEVNKAFGIIAIVIFVVFGLLSIIILPLVFFLTKNAVHRCSRCIQTLGEKSCFGLPDDFSAPIWHFRLGKCSIVTARIYAIIGLVLFAIGSGCYVYMRPSFDFHQNPLVHHNVESYKIRTTWPDFLQDCGGEQVIENFVHTKMVFNDKYENNIITWSGFFTEVKEKQRSIFGFNNEHHLSILVKMEPSESAIFADLVLSVSTSLYEANKAFYDSLRKGDGLEFDATMVSLGNEFKMHHVKAKKVTKNGEWKELQNIVVRESALP